MRGGHQSHDLRLQFVGVLILVHHYVAVLFGEPPAQLRAAFERFAQTQEQIVVGEHVVSALELLEAFE